MADTQTTNLNLTKPEPGAAEDTWGISLNADLDTLDAIFSSSGTQVNLNPNQINFANNKKAIFGANSNLSIYHDGSHSYIEDSGSGNLRILVGDMQIRNYGTNENVITSTANAEVTLYHNASPKLATTSTGIDVTGRITTDGLTTSADINFGDDDKALFGAGNDLKIYHSANNQSYIHETGTGDLNILATNLKLQDSGGSTKVLVNSAGIDVTGTVTSDGLTVNNVSVGDTVATFEGNYSGSGDVKLASFERVGGAVAAAVTYTDASTSMEFGTTTSHSLHLTTGDTRRLTIDNGGDISFYDDTGSTQGLFWDASAESLCLGNTSAGAKFDIRQDSGYAIRAENNLGSYFKVAAGGNTEIGGNVTLSSTAPLLYLANTTSGTGKTWRVSSASNGKFFITQEGVIDAVTLDHTTGNATFAGTVTATAYNTSSDARLKDVTGEARGLEVINELNPVSYNWKADGKADEGLIAQEVQEIVPNAVSGSEEEHYQMDYSKLVVHLVKGMKEQQEQIESLKGEIANLKGK